MRSSDPGETNTMCLRIVCLAPPPSLHDGTATEFGLQDKQRVLDAGEQTDGGVRFVCEVKVRRDPATGTLRFSGPFAHGTAADPFLYLGWRTVNTSDTWIRRWKIALSTITFEQAHTAAHTPNGCLEATLLTLDKTRPALEGGRWKFVTPV